MADEAKFKVGDQWYYRGNRSASWFALASAPDGSATGIAEKIPAHFAPLLERIAALESSLKTALEQPAGFALVPREPTEYPSCLESEYQAAYKAEWEAHCRLGPIGNPNDMTRSESHLRGLEAVYDMAWRLIRNRAAAACDLRNGFHPDPLRHICTRPAALRYPAMGGDFMYLCGEHGEKHRAYCEAWDGATWKKETEK